MRTHEIRRRYLDYFTARDHVQLPSGSLVPPDWDTSVLITTAGMQPFKRYFLGIEQPPAPRATSVPEVLPHGRHRRGREHRPAPHVLRDDGQLLVRRLLQAGRGRVRLGPLDPRAASRSTPSRIWATVYEGDERVEPDDEARALAGAHGRARRAHRAARRATTSGRRGRPGRAARAPSSTTTAAREHGCGRPDCTPGCDCDRFLEFWNLVFMQYDLREDGALAPLPAQNIDTGSGLERVAMLLQGVQPSSRPTRRRRDPRASSAWSGARYARRRRARRSRCACSPTTRRAMTILATDGVTPSNEGRGYVLRRIIRRAVLHGPRIGLERPVPGSLHGVVIESLADGYPELARAPRRRPAPARGRGGALRPDAGDRPRACSTASSRAHEGAHSARGRRLRLHDTHGFPYRADGRARARGRASGSTSGFARADGRAARAGAAPATARRGG